MSEKSTTVYVINLIIIFIAIVLVYITKKNQSNQPDSFVGRVPTVPIGNGYYGGSPGVYPPNVPFNQGFNQPMTYPKQMYPAKLPYYADSVAQEGRPCKNGGCGVYGACVNGECTVKTQKDTVLGVSIN
jgi:hypothetical protein